MNYTTCVAHKAFSYYTTFHTSQAEAVSRFSDSYNDTRLATSHSCTERVVASHTHCILLCDTWRHICDT